MPELVQTEDYENETIPKTSFVHTDKVQTKITPNREHKTNRANVNFIQQEYYCGYGLGERWSEPVNMNERQNYWKRSSRHILYQRGHHYGSQFPKH